MTLLVTGSRDWTDEAATLKALRIARNRWGVTHLVHGDCRGADRIAAHIWGTEIPGAIWLKAFPADWKKHGKAAGIIRNAEMLKASNPDCVLAFSNDLQNSRGTLDMVKRAIKAGVPVYLVTSDTPPTPIGGAVQSVGEP